MSVAARSGDWTGGVIRRPLSRCACGCPSPLLTNALAGFVRKRRTAVRIRRIGFVVRAAISCELEADFSDHSLEHVMRPNWVIVCRDEYASRGPVRKTRGMRLRCGR